MARVIYVNGAYRPFGEAQVHVEDRGFQFADGVYEVCEIRDGSIIDEKLHTDRLWRSMTELRMTPPMGRLPLGVILRETVRRNKVTNGHIYIQVTRGQSRRDFAFPAPETPATLVCYARGKSASARDRRAAAGIGVITMPDIRWGRPDIKSVSLLPNALARQQAHDAGAEEAWLLDAEGFVTEGAACNAWIVSANDEIITRPAETGILRGITRTVLIDLLHAEGLSFVERPFTVAEALAAKEAFNSSAVALVTPVVSIDGTPVGEGRPGPVAARLRKLFHGWAKSSPRHGLLR